MAKTTGKKTQAPGAASRQKSVFDRFEAWGNKNQQKLFYAFLILTLFFSLLLFNARISEAHDDALYLEGGWRYVHEFPNYFYTQNAPLYVLFLGFMVKLFGFKLLLFKLVNVSFNFFGVYFFFKAFHKRLPYIVFVPVMLFISCNYLFQYFASMTFTEAFYMFLQSLFFYSFFKLYDALKDNPDPKAHIRQWLMLGLFTFLIGSCKSSAIVAVPVLVLFFAMEKQWKNVVYSIGAYLTFRGLYELLVRLIWGTQNQFSGQGRILMQKDPYDKSLGDEDLGGFIDRFFDNCNIYLSKRFFQILGLRDENSVEIYGLLAFIVLAALVISLYVVYKTSNKPLLFFGLFTGAQMILSFVILQVRWDQPRIILICMPVMLLLLYYLFYISVRKSGMGQTIYFVVAGIVCGSVLLSSLKRGAVNLPIVQRNLAGDMYYGYTPDWQNFLKCSQWCADSLDKTTLVASRKAPMSFVYGKGKKFFPIYSVIKKDPATNQSNPDSALAFFKEKGVTHVMLGSLRIDPTKNTGQIINTVHNIAQPIMEKYPAKMKLVHTEGTFEPSYVFEIKY